MNAFARSNLSVATLRLAEAQSKLDVISTRAGRSLSDVDRELLFEALGAAKWCVREAARLVENAGALDDMEGADSVPAPDSNTRRMGT